MQRITKSFVLLINEKKSSKYIHFSVLLHRSIAEILVKKLSCTVIKVVCCTLFCFV